MALVDPGVTDTLAEVLTAGNSSSGTNIELTTTDKVQFRDSAIYIQSSADGQLDLVADTEIQIAATTIDINGNVDISGTTVSAGKITADAGIDIDNINIDGTTIALSSGDLTIDVAGDIILDADGGDFLFRDAANNELTIKVNDGSNIDFISNNSNHDMRFRGNDGGSTITALTLDMSEAGAATFNAGATFGGTITTDGMTTSADINFGDNDKAIFGAGSDLQIYHDGTHSNIKESGAGDLQIFGDNVNIYNAAGSQNLINLTSGGASTLFHSGSAKLATTSLGIQVTGTITTTTSGSNNLRLGSGAGASIASGGDRNTVVGDSAGAAITTGDNNTAVGTDAGTSVTTGTLNTLVGALAGDALTTGQQNVALGYGALSADDVGSHSVAVGVNALLSQNYASGTNSYNTAVGSGAGAAVTTGVENTLIGGQAGDSLTDAE